jgi:hypothetical protein
VTSICKADTIFYSPTAYELNDSTVAISKKSVINASVRYKIVKAELARIKELMQSKDLQSIEAKNRYKAEYKTLKKKYFWQKIKTYATGTIAAIIGYKIGTQIK